MPVQLLAPLTEEAQQSQQQQQQQGSAAGSEAAGSSSSSSSRGSSSAASASASAASAAQGRGTPLQAALRHRGPAYGRVVPMRSLCARLAPQHPLLSAPYCVLSPCDLAAALRDALLQQPAPVQNTLALLSALQHSALLRAAAAAGGSAGAGAGGSAAASRAVPRCLRWRAATRSPGAGPACCCVRCGRRLPQARPPPTSRHRQLLGVRGGVLAG